MESSIKTPLFEKFYYGILLFACFGLTSYFLYQLNFVNNSDLDGRKERLNIVCFIFILLGFYSLFKIYENGKSKFIFSKIDVERKKQIVESLVNEDFFKSISNNENEIIKIGYQKYMLGLDYEIHFRIDNDHFEFNTFCNRLGILDFGSRKRILNKVERRINLKL